MKTREITAHKKRGRPSKYSEELADEICRGLAGGLQLSLVCRALKIDPDTVYQWILRHEEFAEKYTRARETQADVLAEQILAIADDDSKDLSGELQIPNAAAVNRSRLRVDARKWFASKVAPKKYGESATLKHEGELKITKVIVPIPQAKAPMGSVEPDFDEAV